MEGDSLDMNNAKMFQSLRLLVGTTENDDGMPKGFGLTDAQIAEAPLVPSPVSERECVTPALACFRW
jgi:hypothetical protein